MSYRFFRILFLIVPIGLIVAFLFRPTLIVGVDGESLAASTGAPVNEFNSVPCTEKEEDVWECTIPGPPEPQPGDSEAVTYEVEIDSLGCWTIARNQAPEETSGCVTIADHVTSID